MRGAELGFSTPSLAIEMNHENPLFEVTGHYFLKERGGFVIGTILSGTFRNGMRIATGDRKLPFLTIAGIEFLDNIREKTFKNALVFREQPSLEFVTRAFPVGGTLVATE